MDNEGESVDCTGFFKSVLFWGPACNKVVCHVYVTFRNFTVSLTGGTCIGCGPMMLVSW